MHAYGQKPAHLRWLEETAASHDVKDRMDAWDAPDGLFALQAKGS